MAFDPQGVDRLNSFALVIYIPNPLDRFLDDLRRELVPTCIPHAHVSVLPPRPVFVPTSEAVECIRNSAREFAPFEIELGLVTEFPVTGVLYLDVTSGAHELREMHAALNRGRLQFEEPFSYHPHVTLAQDFPPGKTSRLQEIAQRRWKEYRGRRRFRGEVVTLVQNSASNRWIDLADFSLGAVTVP